MFIRPTSTRTAEQEIMARRAKFVPAIHYLFKQSGEEIGSTSSLTSMYLATDLKKRDVIAAIPKVRTVFPDTYEHSQSDCRIGQRHCQEEALLSLGTRRGFSSGRLPRNTSTLHSRAVPSLLLCIPSCSGNSPKRITDAPHNAISTFLCVQSNSAASSSTMERFGSSPEHQRQDRRSGNTRVCCVKRIVNVIWE